MLCGVVCFLLVPVVWCHVLSLLLLSDAVRCRCSLLVVVVCRGLLACVVLTGAVVSCGCLLCWCSVSLCVVDACWWCCCWNRAWFLLFVVGRCRVSCCLRLLDVALLLFGAIT